MGWKTMEAGWTGRVNMLLDCINNEVPFEEMKNCLDKDEVEWYKKSLVELQSERALFKKKSEEKGMPYFPICYDTVKLEL